jgi:hypothetical protein
MAQVPPGGKLLHSANSTQGKNFFPEYKNIYSQVQQINLQRLDKTWRRWLTPEKTGNLLVDHASTAQRFSL